VNRAIRPPAAVGACLALAATSLLWLAPGAQASPGRAVPEPGSAAPVTTGPRSPAHPNTLASWNSPASPNRPASPGSPATPGSATGASDVTDLGAHGWRVASSATAT